MGQCAGVSLPEGATAFDALAAAARKQRGGSLFGKYSGAAAEPDGAESTAESAEIPTLTAESTADPGIQPGNTAQGGLTGTHIRIIISAVLGAAGALSGGSPALRRSLTGRNPQRNLLKSRH